MGVHDVLGCLDNSGVVGEAEVIIGAEVDHAFAVRCDFHVLCGRDHTLNLVGTCLLHPIDLGLAHSIEA